SLGKKVTVITEIPEELPCVFVDAQKIEQVLVNLMVNAGHALEKSEAPVIRLSATKQEKTISLFVQDNGSGIPDDKLDKIWMPFFTTKEVGKGTGLGLHICRDIIEAHDGQITATNSDDGGALFQVILPSLNESEVVPKEVE
ncbi:ATP-binding protein, partial [bacterium]|nr:ATP-binding protein [bacterium]